MAVNRKQDFAHGPDAAVKLAQIAKPANQRRKLLTVRGLCKSFNGQTIYDNFDINIPLGGMVSIFGPNGCGKSTFINMISGLMPMDAGEVLYDGATISDTNISYVFQNYREALLPWQRAIDNIHYPLKVRGVPKAERTRRIEKLLSEFDIKIDFNAYPYTLSGGQQQTVCILRALVTDPEVLFLDEPFSALDYEMTLSMREQVQSIFMKTGKTIVLVSHDLEEAVQLSTKVLLLTRRPTRIADFVEIDLPWPRNTEMLTEERFMELKRYCLGIFRRELKSPSPQHST